MNDPFNLERFIKAQASVYSAVQEELRLGRKRSHWMWFIFPQIKGLGSSEMALFYSISSLNEAIAYLEHDILGSRLIACTLLVNQINNKTAHDVFGTPDDIKFRSSMTLFAHAASEKSIFIKAIDKFFAKEEDPLTSKIISAQAR